VPTFAARLQAGWSTAPHRDTVYRESVKQAWRDEDQAQRDARLNYVTTLGNVHQTSEAAQAAAVLTYQQARAEASRIEQDARAALRVDFNKQQASTFATETAGWLTSAPTPWHKQLASQADAESTYRAVEQDASLLQQQAKHAARENYLDDRETARVTLRIDRAATSAADALTEQQYLESGYDDEYYYDDYDRYQNVTIDLPTGLNYDNSSDPDGVSHTLDDDPFSGQFSLGGTFGSQIGGGPDSTDEYGTYFSEYTQYDLANQRADQVRGGAFAANNPLGALGRSDAQANSTQTVNWGVSPRNQQTNEQPPTQIAGLDAGEAPEWQSEQQLDFANGDGPAFGSDFGSYGDSATMSDKVLYYELYDDNGTPNNEADDNFLGYREDHFSGFSLFGGSSPSKSIYTDANGNVVDHIDADREVLGYGQDALRPGDGLPEKPKTSMPPIAEPESPEPPIFVDAPTTDDKPGSSQNVGSVRIEATYEHPKTKRTKTKWMDISFYSQIPKRDGAYRLKSFRIKGAQPNGGHSDLFAGNSYQDHLGFYDEYPPVDSLDLLLEVTEVTAPWIGTVSGISAGALAAYSHAGTRALLAYLTEQAAEEGLSRATGLPIIILPSFDDTQKIPKYLDLNATPKPPQWNQDWRWGPGTRDTQQSWRWWDPDGGEWRFHGPDRHHLTPHWDYNPWNHPSSPWQNHYLPKDWFDLGGNSVSPPIVPR